MQIGFPTDVKHVAHIGSDGPAANTPSWVRYVHTFFFFCIIVCKLIIIILALKTQMNDFKPQENENAQVVSRGNSNKYNPQGFISFSLI